MACQKIDYAFNAATGIFTITGGAGGVVSFQVGANITTVMTTEGLVIMSNGVPVGTIPLAGDTTSGIVQLATSGNYPQHANNTDAATPAYVKAAIDAAIAAVIDLRVTNVTRTADQITVTRSDGQTWTVPEVNVQSFAFVGGAMRITETDGTTHDLTPPAGWSDVFTSYVGTTMTFADGDSVDLANLNESLVRQPDGSISLVDGAGNVSGTIPVWTTADEGTVKKASATDTSQDRLLAPGNGVGAPAVGALDDTKGTTAADWLRLRNSNGFVAAGTVIDVPSFLFPTVGSALTYLKDRFLMGLVTINVTAPLVETAPWPAHANMEFVHITGPALTSPVTHTDRVNTGWTIAALASDIAATKANIVAKGAAQITFVPAGIMIDMSNGKSPRMSNIVFDGLTFLAEGVNMGKLTNVFLLNGAFYATNSRINNDNVWSISTATFAASWYDCHYYHAGGGQFIGGLVGHAVVGGKGSFRTGPSNDLELGGQFPCGFAYNASVYVGLDHPNTAWRFDGPTGSYGARIMAANVVVAGGVTTKVESLVGGIGIGQGGRFIAESENPAFSVVVGKTDPAGHAMFISAGAKVVLPSGNNSFSVAGALEHISVGASAELAFTGPGSTFTGGSPTSNIAVAEMARVSLRGTTLPLGASIPLNTDVNGSRVQT